MKSASFVFVVREANVFCGLGFAPLNKPLMRRVNFAGQKPQTDKDVWLHAKIFIFKPQQWRRDFIKFVLRYLLFRWLGWLK